MSDVWKIMWESLPPGFRFRPTDEEFVNHYLMNYIHGVKEDFNVIPIVDDLFKRYPSELPGLFRGLSIIRSRDPEWWFLSTLRYKSPNVDKFDRSTGKGSWKITGNPKAIHNQGENREIAEMRNLVFCESQGEGATNWVIHEYYLKDTSLSQTLREQRKYVLCHLVNRQDDYTEMSTNMEVDLEFEERRHGFSEEIIQAKMRSLIEGPPSPATNAALHNPLERLETFPSMTLLSPDENFNEMDLAMSMSSGERDNISDLLNQVAFSMDEESTHSDEFDVMSFYKELPEPEGTSRAASNHMVLKENRQARPSGTLEGYVVVDENRRFVEEDFQREEAGDASSLPNSPKTPPTPTIYPMAPPNEHSVRYLRRMEARSADFRGYERRSTSIIERQQSTPPGRSLLSLKEGKAKDARIAGTEPLSLTPGVRRNQSTRPQTLQPRAGNVRMPITSREKNQVGDGCRPPFDYLVNLMAGIVMLVLMILWLLRY